MCADHAAQYCKSVGNNPERSGTQGMEKILAKIKKVWVEKILVILEKVIVLIPELIAAHFLSIHIDLNSMCLSQDRVRGHIAALQTQRPTRWTRHPSRSSSRTWEHYNAELQPQVLPWTAQPCSTTVTTTLQTWRGGYYVRTHGEACGPCSWLWSLEHEVYARRMYPQLVAGNNLGIN